MKKKREKTITLEAQGRLFKASVGGFSPTARGGGLRGRICGLSRASRKRLLEKVARLSGKPLFISLTMAIVVRPAEMKHFLDIFWKRFERRYPNASAIWRFAMESAGERAYHPHFHILIYGPDWIDFDWLADTWREVCGGAGGYIWISDPDLPPRRAAWYIGKYISKEDEERSLEYIAYLTGERWTGRMWGVLNRDFLPWAVRQMVRLTMGKWFFDLKRSARCVWRGVSKKPLVGFTLFRDNPGRWLDLALFYAVA